MNKILKFVDNIVKSNFLKTNFNLENKVIVVTGATGVLGEAFSYGIAEAGGIVGVLGRNKEKAEDIVQNIKKNKGEAITLIADVTQKNDLENAKELLLKTYGQIDGLVNAAGGNIPKAIIEPEQNIFDIDITALQEVLQLNFFGTVLPTQIFGEAIENNHNGGSIVNISTVATDETLTKVLGYSIAKAAVDQFTQNFAVELAHRFGDKIRMNSIAPGFFLTKQNHNLLINQDGSLKKRSKDILSNTPFKRFGNPEELVGALIWLLSDESKYVTGTRIKVDGGFTAFSGV